MPDSARILLADDEETFLFATADQLREEGYEATTVRSAEEVLEALERAPFDLIVSDVRMAAMSGVQLAERLRDVPVAPPIILVTGYPSLRTVIPALHLSVAAYLIKPLDFPDFLRHVRTALEQSRAARTLRELQASARLWIDRAGESELAIRQLGPLGSAATVEGFTNLTLTNIVSSLDTLRRLVGALAGSPDRSPHVCRLLDCPRNIELTRALTNAVEVLEETKSAFKSKQLADLRGHLEQVLRSGGG